MDIATVQMSRDDQFKDYKQNTQKNYLPLTARFPFSETSNLLVAGMRCTSNWTEPERKGEEKRQATLRRKSSSSSVHQHQRLSYPPIPLMYSHLSLVGWLPCGWWHPQKLQGCLPWQPPDFLQKYARPATGNPLLGRGHAHQCSVQSGNALQTPGLCLLSNENALFNFLFNMTKEGPAMDWWFVQGLYPALHPLSAGIAPPHTHTQPLMGKRYK